MYFVIMDWPPVRLHKVKSTFTTSNTSDGYTIMHHKLWYNIILVWNGPLYNNKY